MKGRDALHVAAACLGGATYCVTCDDLVLKRANCCAKVTKEHGFKVILIGPEELRNVRFSISEICGRIKRLRIFTER